MKYVFLVSALIICLASCVSKKKLQQSEMKYAQLDSFYVKVQQDLKACRDEEQASARKRAQMESEAQALYKEIDFLKKNNNQMIGQLKDLSVISSSQAESIKKSLENIGSKDIYIQDLQKAISQKDSLNMALVMNLKSSLADINDADIEIKVEKSAVFISISDKMLFKTGSYDVNEKAMTVLGKVAQVLNSRPEIEFMVEGHTDNVPIKKNCILDNWDLSTKRATSVVRILQNQFKIDPRRITAGGRGEYLPVAANDDAAGKNLNRRTRIVILPQLDQFFKLLESPKS